MTKVVTSILTYDKHILLLKRGNNVRTYQGHWSGISGYLENDETPLERAYQEIKEEVGLTSSQIQLERIGPPLTFTDTTENEKRQWTVYPFLFKSNTKHITLDWENTEYAWLQPTEVKNLKTVPKLLTILEILEIK